VDDRARQRTLYNLLAVVVAQPKTPGTKSERSAEAGEAGSRSIPQIIKMKHCLEGFFDIKFKDNARIALEDVWIFDPAY
jgi:hypothetical protein